MPTGPSYTEDEMRQVESDIEMLIDEAWDPISRPTARQFRSGHDAIGVLIRDSDILIWRGSPVWRAEDRV